MTGRREIFWLTCETRSSVQAGAFEDTTDIALDLDLGDARLTMGAYAEAFEANRGLAIRRRHPDAIYLSDGETFMWLRIRAVPDERKE